MAVIFQQTKVFSFRFGDAVSFYEVRQHILRTQNYLCPSDRRRPNPLRVYSDKQCSTLVDNVLSRHACKQCCDVQHVGLGYVVFSVSCLVLFLPSPISMFR